MEDAGGLCPSLSVPESRLYYQGADERQASLSYRHECLKQSWSYLSSRGTSCPDSDKGFPGFPVNGRRSCSASLSASEVDGLIGALLCTAETTARTSAE